MSPRRSRRPPAGRKAVKSCRNVAASTNEEDEDVDEDSDGEDRVRPWGLNECLETRRGIRGGNADNVAAVKC